MALFELGRQNELDWYQENAESGSTKLEVLGAIMGVLVPCMFAT